MRPATDFTRSRDQFTPPQGHSDEAEVQASIDRNSR